MERDRDGRRDRRGAGRWLVALAGFGLDSLIEIGASTIVIWQLKDTTGTGDQRALRLIGIAFIALAVYLAGAVLLGLIANAALDWWWADPLAGLVIVYYGLREGREALRTSC